MTDLNHKKAKRPVRNIIFRIVVCILVLAAGLFGMTRLASLKKPPAEAKNEERAVRVEALSVQPEDIRVVITGYGEARALNVVGGGANIDVWNQVRSDAFDLEVRKLAVTEATSLGTALFCKAGLDETRSLKDIAGEWIKVDKRFRPNKKHTRTYKVLAGLFETQIQTNRDVYQGLNSFHP